MDTLHRFAVENNWAWFATEHGALLHFLPEAGGTPDLYDRAADEGFITARAVCGRAANYIAPGVLRRLGENRCRKCCEAVGIPEGIGTPANRSRWTEAGFVMEGER